MYTLPSPALFCLASKFGVELAACLLPRIQWRGLLSLGLTLRHMDCTPAHTQGPSLHRLYVIWLVPPGCATWWPFFILLSVFLFYLFFYGFFFLLFCSLHCWLCFAGIKSNPLILVTTSVAATAASSTISSVFIYHSWLLSLFSHFYLVRKGLASPQRMPFPLRCESANLLALGARFPQRVIQLYWGAPTSLSHKLYKSWMGAEGFFLSLLCFVLVMMLFR